SATRIAPVAEPTDDSASLQKIGSASFLGSRVSPSCRLANGRPTSRRLGKLVHTLRTVGVAPEPGGRLDVFLARQRSVKNRRSHRQDLANTGSPGRWLVDPGLTRPV